MKPTKYSSEPAFLRLKKLCSDPKFKKKVTTLRAKWGIDTLAKSFDESDKFWQTLCEVDRKEPDYYRKWYEGKAQDRQLKGDLEELCNDPDVGLSPEMWTALYLILLCFDLDNVTDEAILQLPLHPSQARIAIAPYGLNPIQDNHLYLDVTFACVR